MAIMNVLFAMFDLLSLLAVIFFLQVVTFYVVGFLFNRLFVFFEKILHKSTIP